MKKDFDNYSEAYQIAKEISDAVINERSAVDCEALVSFLEQEKNREKLAERFNEKSETPKIRMRVRERNSKKDLDKMLSKIDNYEFKRKRFGKRLLASVSSVAAVLLVLFLMMDKGIETSSPGKFTENVMVPTLIMENGSKIKLEQTVALNTIVKSKNYNIIVKDKKVDYTSTEEVTEPIFTTLVIPSHYTYTVILEDSTEVILNADSRLKYPVKFVGERREVELEGEAYFKVKKAKKPFVVKSGTTSILVYGTEFNVRTGNDNFETILVRGRIGVTFQNHSEVVLSPNTLLSVRGEEMNRCEVNPEDYISWVNGVFYYDEQPLSRVLDDISKWYGVSFQYNKELGTMKVSMNMSKESGIDAAVNFMQMIISKQIIKEERGKYTIE